ncbi:hypothetical protein GUITHDRAFT_160179 [Guillardia theta CCMP2712]|uniref:ABC transporter domain-containing protein n=1 Tax=Guillardia theta (strain CCMP2712) TaxID=905079 RepID=L1II26_GUITC|nr:hypothetical protein GUITHDRAFT_160179 [Guillardia theta CCMP2712]EKX35871.1 hypothetical protein GUITHDRAFT_160179 [Guillardia theta CCMP2712]|eukprot:XP_005822851.1 hypothetical protein GUITHDRAFT_160179 [Guillardia theta CCMP2712]
MAMPYFKEEKSARVLLAVVIGFTLLNSGVSVGFSYLGRDFWTALSSKNADNFYPLLQKYVLALAGGTPVSVLYKFYRDKLAMEWRSWMTKRILDMFEARRNFYELETKSEIDNPDQRIAEDARAFTRVSLDFSITLLTSIIDLASFSTILYSIYPELFAAILVYSGFGTGCTLFIGNKLVGINFEQLQREANFRFSLVRMRENAESIAFYGGENIEMKEIKKRFQSAIDNSFRLISNQRNLELFTVAYRYMVQGKIELGVVSQSYGAFNHILSDLSIIVNQTPDNSRVLIENLNIEVQKGQHLLIVGNSGAGKSSLLRAIAGLWTAGKGEITRPPPGETFFLPQRPYCTLGSLREQVRGGREGGSRGGREQRRKGGGGAHLSVRVAILDEASSALDLMSEKSMYELLENLPHLTYISVGHRPSLLHYHDMKLKLKGDKFEIEKIADTSEKQQIVAL